jgi:hypothetical protein
MAKHQTFVTEAVVKAFDGDLTVVEEYARQSSKGLKIGDAIEHDLADPDDPDARRITLVTARFRDRTVVAVPGDPDAVANCLQCLKAGRIEPSTVH